MNIDIRQAVLANLNSAGYDTMESTIKDAITSREEKALPGLGVLFELYWRNASDETKTKIVNALVEHVKG